MVDQHIPYEPDITKPDSILVFSFPKKSPTSSVMRNDITAIEQLNHYRMIRDYWCEHNPSTTIYVKPDEWLAVGDWIYTNWDDVGGISFLPHSDHVYKQAPFVDINESEYNRLNNSFPIIDYTQISKYESDDNTTSTHELACVSGVCMV